MRWRNTAILGRFLFCGSYAVWELLPRHPQLDHHPLLAFVIVCAAVLIMRKTNPDAERPFRVPLYPLTPIFGILTCLLLMFSLPSENWWRLIIWMAVGFVIYFSYGYKRSVMATQMKQIN